MTMHEQTTHQPTTQPQARELDPDELRAELSKLRAELSETVEALVERLDVPSRVQGKVHEVADRAKQSVGVVVDQAHQKAQEAGQLVSQKVPEVTELVRRRPVPAAALGAGGLLVAMAVVWAVMRRSG